MSRAKFDLVIQIPISYWLNDGYRYKNTTDFYNYHSLIGEEVGQFSTPILTDYCKLMIINKGAKIRNRYNQVTHLTKDTNGKVTNSQLDTTNKSQEVSR